MIAYIKGKITARNPALVVIETGNIGYEIHISLNTYSKIQDLEECQLHTYFHVKEDAQTLYGFAEEAEKSMFILLISVSGIGPNTGRMILSSMTANDIRNAILTEDEKRISSIKGIGPKSAKRLILELKDKLAKQSDPATIISPTSHNTAREEALSALGTLGFSRAQSEKALDKSLKGTTDSIAVEDLIKIALNNL